VAAERWDEQVGSVADEATRLLESLRRSAAEAQAAAGPTEGADGGPATRATGADAPAGGTASGPSTGDAADAAETGPGPGGGAEHDPFCTWCPLCRGAAVVRSLSPETLTRLADLAGVAASVLADLATARATQASGGPDAPSATRRPAPTASRPIPVRDADDPQEEPRG
jgi:hypothetical protein